MTSRRLMFIQLSQLTRCPLYVSPFFSSTSCKRRESRGARTAPSTGTCPGVSGEPGTGPGCGTGAGLCCRYLPWGGSAPSSTGTGAATRGREERGLRHRREPGHRPQHPEHPAPAAERGEPDPPRGSRHPWPPGRRPPARPGPAAHHRAGAATAPGAAAQTAPGPARGQSERGAAPAEPIRARTRRCGRKANARSAPFTTAPQTEERDGKRGHALASRRSQRPVPVPRI